jgi:ketosteroid isomerase-like protein
MTLHFHPTFPDKVSIAILPSLTITRGFLLVSIALACCSVAHAQSATAVIPAEEAAIEAGIKDLSMQWSTAILKKDPAIIARILASDFVSVEPSGQRFTKAEVLAALITDGGQPTVSEASPNDVRVYGGGTVAAAIGDYKEAGTSKDGKPYERRSRFANVWVLEDGAW